MSGVGGTLMLYVYSAQPWLFRFSRHRPSTHHAHSCQAAQGPARPSEQGCIAAPGAYGSLAWCTWLDTFQFRQSELITSGALIPECNGLSRCKEDTGESSWVSSPCLANPHSLITENQLCVNVGNSRSRTTWLTCAH